MVTDIDEKIGIDLVDMAIQEPKQFWLLGMVEVQNFTDKPTFHHAWDLKDKEAKKKNVKTGVNRLFVSISTPFFIYFPTEFLSTVKK